MPFTRASLGSRLRLLLLLFFCFVLAVVVVAVPATAKYAKQIKFDSIRFRFQFTLYSLQQGIARGVSELWLIYLSLMPVQAFQGF